jgi:hypothetical protein
MNKENAALAGGAFEEQESPSLARPRRIAIARSCAAVALLRESLAAETTSAARSDYLARLAFSQLVRGAEAIEPELGDGALDLATGPVDVEIVN